MRLKFVSLVIQDSHYLIVDEGNKIVAKLPRTVETDKKVQEIGKKLVERFNQAEEREKHE
jgi:hypothetical protein